MVGMYKIYKLEGIKIQDVYMPVYYIYSHSGYYRFKVRDAVQQEDCFILLQ